ncbi:6-phosphogluconolactonase [Rhizobium sp. EC-SD404]|nr:6-phosphogluconolactonase [Rhizobium sp. EC-SD404]
MPVSPKLHEFADRAALAEALADAVAEALNAAVSARGRATLAVSGGSTPKSFFKALSGKELAWDQVTVTLIDERFVPETHERSNQKLVVENLLVDRAARARFVPLFNDAPEVHLAADRASGVIDALPRPIDVAILGLGTDGHTASFFPGGDRLAETIDPDMPTAVIPIEAPGAGEPRLTLTLPRIVEAPLLVLHIEGAEKRQVLDQAMAGQDANDMPIRAVFAHAPAPIQIYWAP